MVIPVVFPVAYLPKNSHIKFCAKRSCLKKVMVKKPKLIYFWPVLYYPRLRVKTEWRALQRCGI